jgi:hypothetical protein
MIGAADDSDDIQQHQIQHGEEATTSLQGFFTLPFALHLRPLPHVSYLAQEDSADSSDADRDGGSSISSNESHYKAGRHRLRPAVQSVSPHPLSTVSILLERTGCLEAVPQWTKLLNILEKADEDAHFTNLRQFFDARFDGEGRLVSDKSKEAAVNQGEKESSGIFGRRTNSVARHRSRTQSGQSALLGAEESTRRGSNASKSSSRPPATRHRSQLGRSISAADDQGVFSEQDEGASSIGEEIRSQPSNMSPSRLDRGFSQKQKVREQSPLTAPEINFAPRGSVIENRSNGTRRRSASSRPVRFRIRLDLHSVHLAPRPPRGTVTESNLPMRSRSQRAFSNQQAARLTGSPTKGIEMQRVVSLGASSGPSYADGISLHSVVSPDSAQSPHLSDGSHSDDHHRSRQNGNDLSVSPQRKSTNQSYQSRRSRTDRSGGRTMTGSSAATNLTSLFGSSPEAQDEKRRGTSPSNNIDEGKRRPSMIQRLMNFNGRRHSSSSRKRGSTNQSNASTDDQNGLGEGAAESKMKERKLPTLKTIPLDTPDTTTMSSPLSIDAPQSRSFSMAMNSRDAFNLRIRGKTNEGSEWSNEEEALDIADDEGSVGSSGGWVAKGQSGRRKSSSGMLPSNAAGLLPVHEEKVFDSMSAFSGNYHDGKDIEEENEDEAEWAGKDDFLSLLRMAAHTTLTLRDSPHNHGPVSTPKSTSSANGGLLSPPGSLQEEQRRYADELLAPFTKQGNEEHPDSWWLCGKADPLPISFACALSQAMGWQGIMRLCYGKESRCSKSNIFASLSKAAELHGKLQEDTNKVRNWAQAVSQVNDELTIEEADGNVIQGDVDTTSIAAVDDELAPSESASASKAAEAKAKASKLSKWMNRIPGRGLIEDSDTALSNTVPSLAINDKVSASRLEERTWQDWADLFASIAAWVEEYESTRVRSGMAREIDREPSVSKDGNRDEDVVYTSMASYQVPRCVIKDALEADNGFRRRHGIPEGLPAGPDGEEVGDYRWARSKLTSSHFATSLVLATSSLSYFYGQLAASEWTYNSSWELDYLEMCVFHSDIISTRFPSPCTSIVPFDQVYQPTKDDIKAVKRAKTCPYPHDGAWNSNQWQEWLTRVQSGMILVPAVSWQAWWTLIAVLNGADGSGRALDLQVKAAEEPFSALEDMNCFYI